MVEDRTRRNREQEHRHEIDRGDLKLREKALVAEVSITRVGQWAVIVFVALMILAAFVLLILGYNWAAVSAFAVAVVSVIGSRISPKLPLGNAGRARSEHATKGPAGEEGEE